MKKLVFYSEIILHINEKGNQNILYEKFPYLPTEIIINGHNVTINNKSLYELNDTLNEIHLKWNFQLNSCKNMFNNLSNITFIDLSKFDSQRITNMENMFLNCSSLTSINFGNIRTSLKIPEDSMARSSSTTALPSEKNGFNTSKVENMMAMFKDCISLDYLNLKSFDISSVTNMKEMFSGCTKLKSVDISKFNALSVIEMSRMFYNCIELLSLNFRSFFISSSLNDTNSMFLDCKNLCYLNLSNFNTSKVVDMNNMFKGCEKLKTLLLNNFNTQSVINMKDMFNGCRSLSSLDIHSFDTSSVKYMDYMFYQCSSLENLNLSNFNTSSVIDMNSMFYGCDHLKSLYLDNFKTKNVIDMKDMFNECKSLESLDLQNYNTKNVESMKNMFNKCQKLQSLNLNNFNTSKVKDMGWMFYDCNSLTYLNINNFDTSKVTNMEGMFTSCINLTILNLNNFYTPKVINMKGMFNNCTSLKIINLANADTSNVTDMTDMFNKCKSLIFLNLKLFDTSKVEAMNATFYMCTSLLYLNLNYFKDSSIGSEANCSNLFDFCNNSLKLCFNEESIGDKCTIPNNNKNCSHECFQNNAKFIIEENLCVDNCSNISKYKYEYNNVCYEICPNDSHISPNNEYLCEDDLKCSDYYNYDHSECIEEIPEGYYCNDTNNKTLNICDTKCKTCSLDSVKSNNLCLSCNINENYFPKYYEILNHTGFINCYNESLDEYYLENNTFMPCYKTCKMCNKLGDQFNHSCTECFSNFTNNNSNCYEICEFYYYFDSDGIYHCTENEACPKNFNKLIINKRKCIDNCDKDDTYKKEYHNSCYESCPNGTHLNNNETKCIDDLIENLTDTILNNLTEYFSSDTIEESIIYNLNEQNYSTNTVQTIIDNFTQHYFLSDKIDTIINKFNIKGQNCSKEMLIRLCNMIKEDYFFDCYNNNSLDEYYLLINETVYENICQIFKDTKNKNYQNCIECNLNYFIYKKIENIIWEIWYNKWNMLRKNIIRKMLIYK